ncbi:MAG: cation transporter [Woeseiaceae bacterium]|nr:cation transporter [Woeseiaceae bacterium]
MLHGGDRENLNMRGAALHVLGDLLGSVAAIAAALVILATGWLPIDPLLSVVVAMLVLRSAWMLVRRSSHILLEGTPDWLDVRRPPGSADETSRCRQWPDPPRACLGTDAAAGRC